MFDDNAQELSVQPLWIRNNQKLCQQRKVIISEFASDTCSRNCKLYATIHAVGHNRTFIVREHVLVNVVMTKLFLRLEDRNIEQNSRQIIGSK